MSSSIISILTATSVLMLLVISIQAESSRKPGSASEERPADDHVRSLVKKFEPRINAAYGNKLASIEPLAYIYQQVAGGNYFIRVKLTATNGAQGFIHMNIWDTLFDGPKWKATRLGVNAWTPLGYFDRDNF